MPTTIKQIKKDNEEIIETTLDVKVYQKINDNFYVIVDETGHVLLESNQVLEENIGYKLMKPKFINKTLQANPKLKMLKTKGKLEGTKLTKVDLKHYEETASASTPNQDSKHKKQLNNFTKCEALYENYQIEMLTLLIVSKSRDTEGKYGN